MANPVELFHTNRPLWAVQHMLKHVYVPAFLNKLASYGIQARSNADVQSLVKMAAMLSELDNINTVANESNNVTSKFIKESADELTGTMCGVTESQQQQEQMRLASLNNWVRNDPALRLAATLYAAASMA